MMTEPYFSSDNKEFVLYQGDSMNLIDKVGKQVDVIFADPPYFLSKNISRCINGVWKTFEKGEWDRVASFEKINDFNRQWLVACRKRLKNGGTIFVTGTYHNIFSVASCMQELGYKILNIICWQKQTPNQLCRATILILQQNILFGQEKMKNISISLIVI